jgi:hypothetical protein
MGKLKTLKAAFGVGLLILAGVLSGPIHVSRAQILVGGFTNQSDTLAPLSSVPAGGTFWSAQLSMPPWPFALRGKASPSPTVPIISANLFSREAPDATTAFPPNEEARILEFI